MKRCDIRTLQFDQPYTISIHSSSPFPSLRQIALSNKKARLSSDLINVCLEGGYLPYLHHFHNTILSLSIHKNACKNYIDSLRIFKKRENSQYFAKFLSFSLRQFALRDKKSHEPVFMTLNHFLFSFPTDRTNRVSVGYEHIFIMSLLLMCNCFISNCFLNPFRMPTTSLAS